jgi:uncharacterized RDD family membrane protein YckC
MTVFVSYSSRDKDAVKSLAQDLQDADEQVWLDQRLGGGDAWWRAILEQIRECDVFVFALSQNSIQSRPCQSELSYARDLGLPILPVQVGSVDSMQLNPLATVQAVDYRNPTPSTAMRLFAGLHRERARRQSLPSPLPEEPAVPFEYLIRLYTTIAGPDQLSPREQAALLAQLEVGLREDGAHDVARKDIVTLLGKLRDREDVTYRIRTEVDEILASTDQQPLARPTIGADATVPAEEGPGGAAPGDEMLATAGAGEADAADLPITTPPAHAPIVSPVGPKYPALQPSADQVAEESQPVNATSPSTDSWPAAGDPRQDSLPCTTKSVPAASSARRLGAALIDAIPISIVYLSALAVAILSANRPPPGGVRGTYDGGPCQPFADADSYTLCYGKVNGTGLAALVIGSLLVLAYSVWNWGYRQGTTGATVGKSARKFKVLNAETGQPVGFGTNRIVKIGGVALLVLLPLSFVVYLVAIHVVNVVWTQLLHT